MLLSLLSQPEESIAAESLKNSVNMLENVKILEKKNIAGSLVIYLTNEYNSQDAVVEVIRNIERFKK